MKRSYVLVACLMLLISMLGYAAAQPQPRQEGDAPSQAVTPPGAPRLGHAQAPEANGGVRMEGPAGSQAARRAALRSQFDSNPDAKRRFEQLPGSAKRALVRNGSASAIMRLRVKNASAVTLRRRPVLPEQAARAVSRAQQARQGYRAAASEYRQKQQDFNQSRARLARCQADNGTNCTQLREQAKEHARGFVQNSARMIQSHLERLRARIAASEDLSEEQVAEMTQGLDKALAEIEDVQERLSDADEKEEIRNAARTLSSIWQRFRPQERVYAGRLANEKMFNILRRSQIMELRLERTLEMAEEQNISAGNISSQIDQFSQKIFDARQTHQNASLRIRQAEELRQESAEGASAQIAEMIDQARKFLREAHEDLKEAQAILADILQQLDVELPQQENLDALIVEVDEQ